MVPFPLLAVAVLIVRLVLRAQGKGQPLVVPDPRRLFWLLVAVVGLVIAVPIGIGLLIALADGPTLGTAVAALAFSATMAAGSSSSSRRGRCSSRSRGADTTGSSTTSRS